MKTKNKLLVIISIIVCFFITAEANTQFPSKSITNIIRAQKPIYKPNVPITPIIKPKVPIVVYQKIKKRT
mgnify:CR=1 FL=1